MMRNRYQLITVCVILIIISLPYYFAYTMGGKDYMFTGFLLNPIDGASYLAKMYQGWTGSWLFRLPYSPEQNSGAYIFLFYLFLGHVARLTGLTLIMVYHIVRIAGSIFFLFALDKLIRKIIPGNNNLVLMSFFLVLFGSGMGWLMIFSGHIPFDMWVAEAYPFLSMYSNPHFPIGLGLLLLSLSLTIDNYSFKQNLKLSCVGLLISIIYPFGLILIMILVGGWTILDWVINKRLAWKPFISLGISGGPILLYQFLVIQNDPVLSLWNSQNVTLSPPFYETFLSLSPAMVFAIIGGISVIKSKLRSEYRILLVWSVLGLVLMYFPFQLQRRFSLGIYIPISVLAVIGIYAISQKSRRWAKTAFLLLVVLSLPTNILLVVSGAQVAITRSDLIYITRDEHAILMWVQENVPNNSVILASPDSGLLIPAFTGQRVIYGHPFETTNAEQKKLQVLSFYEQTSGISSYRSFLGENNISYILYGPREKKLGGDIDFSEFIPVAQSGEVILYTFP